MATIAAEPRADRRRAAFVRSAAARIGMLVLVLAVLWGFWEGYRWLWIREGWTWPFVVDSTTMPHIHDILAALFRKPTSGTGDILLVQLLHATWFTAKEALVGFALGATFGFLLGVALSEWRLLQRGLLPYVVSSQTVPILAVAPSSIQEGLGGFIVNFNQYYSLNPENLWATNLMAALLGIAFFVAVVIVETIVVRRAPENVA